MSQFERYYTIEEANALLPEVRELLEEIRGSRHQLASAWQAADPALREAPSNGGSKEASGFVAQLSRVSRLLRWFADRGIQLKDLEQGLVDFPALRDGEEVLLCWQAGEERVVYWHTLEAGYAGRRRW